MAYQCPSRKRKPERGRKGRRGKGPKNPTSCVYVVEEKGRVPIVVEATIGSTTFNVPLDSYAMENVISYDFLQQVAPEATRSKLKFVLKGFGDCRIKPKGVATVSLTIDGHSADIQCAVVDRFNHNMILGLPGLEAMGIKADFGTRTVSISGKVVPVKGEPMSGMDAGKLPIDIDEGLTARQQDRGRLVSTFTALRGAECSSSLGLASGY